VGLLIVPGAVFAPASLHASESAPRTENVSSSTPTDTQGLEVNFAPKTTYLTDYQNADGECSCVVYARSRLSDLPRINTPADLTPNADPLVGNAVLLQYQIAHIAIIEEVLPDGVFVSEVNFSRSQTCQVTGRFISWRDPALRGFFRP
jgi:hypothetical protein